MCNSRAPYQILVFVFRKTEQGARYLLLKRADLNVWQGVAGGGEGSESPYEAAVRELLEETGLTANSLIQLESLSHIPVLDVTGDFRWGRKHIVIPEYAFAFHLNDDARICISEEHTEYEWLDYDSALTRLCWDSNRTALWELNERVQNDEI